MHPMLYLPYPSSRSNAYCTRVEFCTILLIRMGKLNVEDLKKCQAQFDKLDIKGNGCLQYEPAM